MLATFIHTSYIYIHNLGERVLQLLTLHVAGSGFDPHKWRGFFPWVSTYVAIVAKVHNKWGEWYACIHAHQLLQFPPGHIMQGALFWQFECSYITTYLLCFTVNTVFTLYWFPVLWLNCELICLQHIGTCFAPCIATQRVARTLLTFGMIYELTSRPLRFFGWQYGWWYCHCYSVRDLEKVVVEHQMECHMKTCIFCVKIVYKQWVN